MEKLGMQIGIDRFLFADANAPSGAKVSPVPDLLEEVRAADEAGLTVYGIDEHHTAEFADSSPAVLLAAAAAQTRRIRLSSAISILSIADPVRLMEDFSTLDLASDGRAEIIAGRGAYAEAFSLFGLDLGSYDALYAEKMELLLRLRSGEPVQWKGRFRAPLNGQITFPRPVQPVLPVWVGATGSPESFIRAGMLGLPLALGVVGGNFARLRPLVDLYREAGRQAGHAEAALKVAVHAVGFIGETAERARADFFPCYSRVFGELARKAGWPPLTPARFGALTAPGEALVVGDEKEVEGKIRALDRDLGGVARVCLQMTVGPLPREHRLGSIARLAKVASRLADVGA